MAKRGSMTNRELEEVLRQYSLINHVYGQFEGEREALKSQILTEFDKRGITTYKGKNIEGTAKSGPVYDYFDGVLEDFTLDQLHGMGALGLNMQNFKSGSGKNDAEIKKYRKTVGKKAPQLNVTPKVSVKKDFLDQVKRLLRYPVTEEPTAE